MARAHSSKEGTLLCLSPSSLILSASAEACGLDCVECEENAWQLRKSRLQSSHCQAKCCLNTLVSSLSEAANDT